jgi:hypothetical protein
MSAESSLTAVAVVRALLNEDTEGLVVLLPDGLPEPGRELIASLASLTVLSAKVAAQGRAHYGRRVPGTGSSGSGRTARADSELVMVVAVGTAPENYDSQEYVGMRFRPRARLSRRI